MDRMNDHLSPILRRMMRLLLPVAGALLVGMIYYLGIYSERTGFVDQVLDPGLKRITKPVLNAFRGRPPKVLELNILIGESERDSLFAVREQALDEGWLHGSASPLFPATLGIGIDTVPARFGLVPGKGDRFSGDRWPIRLFLDGPDTAILSRSLTLLPVVDPSPLHAWSFRCALADAGIPTFGIDLADIRLDGRDLGLYVLEGGTDSSLFRTWGRGSGPLIRFDDELYRGLEPVIDAQRYPSVMPVQGEWLSAPMLVERPGDATGMPPSNERERSAMRSLDEFRAGGIRASQVFEVDALARLIALCDLFGAQESMSWWNLRALVDSVSGKLILIPKRYMAGTPIHEPLALRTMVRADPFGVQSDLLGRLLNDAVVMERYLAYADTICTSGWLEEFKGHWSDAFEKRARIIRAELPGTEFDHQVYDHDRNVLRSVLHPRDLVLASARIAKGRITGISVANIHALPVRLTSVVSGPDTLSLSEPWILKPRERSRPLKYTIIPLDVNFPEDPGMEVEVSIVGLTEPRYVKTRSWTTFPAQ